MAGLRWVVALAGLAVSGCITVPAPYPVYVGQPTVMAAPAEAAPQSGYAPQSAAFATTCYAGFYTCALEQSVPPGGQCSCPGLGAPSFGTAH